MTSQQPSPAENFSREFHGIPDDERLEALSFAELASELASSEKDSPKFRVIDREMKRHLAKDQARINLPNMLWAAGCGGIFALVGVVLGWCLTMNQFPEKTHQANHAHQINSQYLDSQNIVKGVPKPDSESPPSEVIPRAENSLVVDASNTAKHPAPP